MALGHTDKMVVFSTFRVFFEEVMRPWLRQINVDSLLFCGGSKTQQQSALRNFHADEECKILLVVKSAGSEGLNLQYDANVCVIMDPHFNLALDEQAAQRIDRIGQVKEVIVRKLYMEGSIDEAMRLMQEEKQLAIEAWGTKKHEGRSLEIHGLFLARRDTVQ